MKKILLLLPLMLLLSGCSFVNHEHETVTLYRKTQWTFDNIELYAPQNFFASGYTWVEHDEHTVYLVIEMSDKKQWGALN